MNIISAGLMTHISDLLNGSQIEVILTDSELEKAIELGKATKSLTDALETERKVRVSPLNEQLKEINGAYREKQDALDHLLSNLRNVCGVYQIKKREEAEKAYQLEQARVREEQKRLADEADRKIREAEALEAEAQQKLDAGDHEGGNLATDTASVAMQEAIEATRAVEKVEAKVILPPSSPDGFKARFAYSAFVENAQEALVYLAKDRFPLIDSVALRKVIQGAGDKLAKLDKEGFRLPGMSLRKTADSTFNPRK